MKLDAREHVAGTRVTIGRRVYYRAGQKRPSRRYAAEFRDAQGVQHCRNLKTTNHRVAHRMAVEIQRQLDRDRLPPAPLRWTMRELIGAYQDWCRSRPLAPTTRAKYDADLNKFRLFCEGAKLSLARQCSETDLHQYRQWLLERRYAPKTIYAALILVKQLFKWAWCQGYLEECPLRRTLIPKATARPQPCFTSDQVDQLIAVAHTDERVAFALMGYMGLRIGEVEQLQWPDLHQEDGVWTMIHIRRGGSQGRPKDRDDRFVPVHPKVAPVLAGLTRSSERVLPSISERLLLARLKSYCRRCGFENPRQFKLHSFRHHFASLCANHHIAQRKVLAWLGHSSSEVLNLYYHLHDEDSREAMAALARG